MQREEFGGEYVEKASNGRLDSAQFRVINIFKENSLFLLLYRERTTSKNVCFLSAFIVVFKALRWCTQKGL